MLETRHERLNALAKLNGAQRYLEIGVRNGATFTRVGVPYRVAVDPDFRLRPEKFANEQTIFHAVTSDEFFSRLAAPHGLFDLIYLDGLHTFEQTFRDFCASLAFSHPRTIWLIDDTVPVDRIAALRSQFASIVLRKLTLGKRCQWMGDVYRVVLAIHDFFPQFSLATFQGHGQTVVWREARRDFRPTWNSLTAISRASLGSMRRHMVSHFVPLKDEELLGRVASAIKDLSTVES